MVVPAAASPALVQHVSKDAGTTLSSSLAFPLNNASGNWIAVAIRAGHSGQTFTVSDTRGNTYQQAVLFNQTMDTPNGDTLGIFYAENIAAGANTVTVAESISNNTLRFAILEYSGLATNGSLDVTATSVAQGSGSSANSGSGTMTASGDLVLGAFLTGSGVTFTPVSGFTIEERVPAAPNTKLVVEDQVQTAAGAVSASATLSASASWAAAVAAFKAAVGGGGSPPSITNLSPASGLVGTPVAIAGTGFGSIQGGSSVTFNGISTNPTSWSNASIVAPVPPGATSGNVLVTVGSVMSNGVNFSVIPNIASISPISGAVGTPVTINGTGFGAAQGASIVSFNGTVATPTNWSAASIVAPVPAGTVSGNLVVTVGGVPSNSVPFTAFPVITSLSPNSGQLGSSVTISGMNFAPTQGTSTVMFNGTATTASNWSATSIVASVPITTTGNVVVTVASMASNGANFTVTPPTAPTNLAASVPVPQSTVIDLSFTASTDSGGIANYLLERCQGAGCINFVQLPPLPGNIVPFLQEVGLAPATSYSFRLRATDAAGNVSGYSNIASATTPFAATITNEVPASGPVGTPVTLTGMSFGAAQGTSAVTFNGIVATPTSWSDTSITVPVPVGATTGLVYVVLNGVDSNQVQFTVTTPPIIASLNPTSGTVGSLVTISGTSFGVSQGTSTVSFNGTVAAPTNWTTTSITVPVPVGATTGNLVVTVGGQASNGVVFTVSTAPTAIKLVQHASKDAGTTSSSSLAFAASNTAGNFIAVAIRAGHSGQVFTIGDTRGNSYRQAVLLNQTLDTPNGDTLAIFYAENINGGANTVTVSDSISNNTMRFAILEYSGVATTSSLDPPATALAQGTGVSPGSGNVTPTVVGDLILGALMSGSGATFTAGSGFTVEDRVPAAPNSKLATEDQVQATVGAVSANATLSASASWGVAVAAFKAASAGGSSGPTITNLNPASGAVGSLATILGTNFGATQGTSTITFNGISASPTSWSATSISVTVPASLPTGSANVVVTVNNVPSNGATFTVTAPPAISVTVTPVRGGVTVTQPLSLTAAVQNDSSNVGVSWSVSGGTLSGQTSLAATFMSTGPGVYTITATSKADVTRSASAVIGVTDLPGITTWRGDNSRSGVNSHEYALTPQNVTTTTFAKLFSCAVDGLVFAQPLWVPNVSIAGASHNVVFVATENDSLYAFDADGPGCKPVWSSPSVSLISSGEVVVPFADVQKDNALGPVVGITGTPVIDLTSQTIYLVALTEVSGTSNVVQRLHVIDITTGHERTGSPQIISASVNNATGYDNSGGTIAFAPSFQKQRPALLLLNGVIYISWAGFLDTDFYHGWVIGYDATTLAQVTVFNDTPDGGRGGIWMSGGGPAADTQGNIYLLTGNGDFNANSTGGRNYGDTFLRLGTTGGLSVADWFTPHDQGNMANNDLDLGGGGAVILFDQPGGPFPHLVLGGSKGGMLYVVSRDGLGHFNSTNDSQIVQSFVLGSNGIYSAPLFWQNTLYAAGSGSTLGAYPFSPATDQFQTSPSVVSNQIFSHPGTTPSLSAAGTSSAILWAIRRPSATAPAVLHAFDPTNIHTGLWDSSQATGNRDQAGVAVKFTVPTVANGKVYIGTQTELDVYGLLPN